MANREVRGESVQISDKSTILHNVFGVHEVEARLPDGSTGRAVDEDRDQAESRAIYNARVDQERNRDDD